MCIHFQELEIKTFGFMVKNLNFYIVIAKFGISLNLNLSEKYYRYKFCPPTTLY